MIMLIKRERYLYIDKVCNKVSHYQNEIFAILRREGRYDFPFCLLDFLTF